MTHTCIRVDHHMYKYGPWTNSLAEQDMKKNQAHTRTLGIWENANKSKIIVQSGLSTFLMLCNGISVPPIDVYNRSMCSKLLCAVCILHLENKTYTAYDQQKTHNNNNIELCIVTFCTHGSRRPSAFCIICFKFYGWVTTHIPLNSIKQFGIHDVEVISVRVVHGLLAIHLNSA